MVDTTYTQFKIEKLCLDQFEQLQSPTGESSIEAGGAIGLLTTARPVLSSTNFRLNQALHGAILAQSNSQYNRLGDIVRYTKNNSLQGVLNRNFILLADPSMKLTYPKYNVVFDELNDSPLTGNDTIRAFQNVKLSAYISNNGSLNSDFNGRGNITVFDKNSQLQTLGDENDPFDYDSRNVELFKGEVSIVNGEFNFEFVVPRNINYVFGQARVSMYAQNGNNSEDAAGSLSQLILGGSASPSSDVIGPEIKAFINNTTSYISGEYDNQIQLLLKLEDESGINISSLSFGQDIEAILNDSMPFTLNDLYRSEINNYRKGNITLSLDNLASGLNMMRIKAWDNVGNSNSTAFEFQVKKNNYITKINNYLIRLLIAPHS